MTEAAVAADSGRENSARIKNDDEEKDITDN